MYTMEETVQAVESHIHVQCTLSRLDKIDTYKKL